MVWLQIRNDYIYKSTSNIYTRTLYDTEITINKGLGANRETNIKINCY